MPRPIQYEKTQMEELIRIKETEGKPIKAQCREKGWPYVSVNRAITRYGLKIPKKYAEVQKKAKEAVVA